jgi:hypothetical protein
VIRSLKGWGHFSAEAAIPVTVHGPTIDLVRGFLHDSLTVEVEKITVSVGEVGIRHKVSIRTSKAETHFNLLDAQVIDCHSCLLIGEKIAPLAILA